MKTISKILIILLIILHQHCFGGGEKSSAASPKDTTRIIPWRLMLVGGSAASLLTIAHLQNYHSWWKGTLGPFHMAVDDAAPLGADKCGHFLYSYYVADLLGRSCRWSGMEPWTGSLYGSAFAFALQLYVEIEDGFHPKIGFSLGDLAANTFGTSYAFLQQHYPFLDAISPKWSASPSTRYLRHEYRTIIDDYESQTYWLSFNIKSLVGDQSPNFIPGFLNIALGYGVTNLDLHGGGDREIYVSLDIDVNKLPGTGDFLLSLKRILNYVHFPAPAIRLTPTVICYGLRF